MFESNKEMMTQVLPGFTWPYSRDMALINVLSIKQNAL
jgi:hypothetical protein